MWLLNPSQIVAAITIDLVIGDPHGWPHIARCAGVLSTLYEKCLTRYFPRSILLGLLFWLWVVGTMVAGYLVVRLICSLVSPVATYLFDIFVIYQAVAAKDLHKHAKTVMQALLSGDMRGARTRLSYIVGRDTRDLDASEISRATIESVAESLVDGIVAPLFWAIIGGAPGALIYRTANTLDSMVGHRTPTYEKFGKPSARIDDLLNWVPARLCALIICLFHVPASWPKVRREAAAHASPNAGWPEAAMAYALDVRLGGTNLYDGVPVQGPIFNVSGRAAGVDDIRTSLSWVWRVVLVASGFFLLLSLISPRERKGISASLHSVTAGLIGAQFQRDHSDFVPKGLKDSARGFNPWEHAHTEIRPEGAEDISDRWFVWSDPAHSRHRFCRPFRAGQFLPGNQGLKPLAESLSPFGTKIATLSI